MLAGKAALAAAEASGNATFIAEAERALEAAEAKAKKTSAGKAAGGERPRRQREVPARTSPAGPATGEPSCYLVVAGRADGVRCWAVVVQAWLRWWTMSHLYPLSDPSCAGSIVKGDGSFVGDQWNKERSRISVVKSAAKKKLEAANASGVGVTAAQAAFDAVEASRVEHNLLPHVAISHHKKK